MGVQGCGCGPGDSVGMIRPRRERHRKEEYDRGVAACVLVGAAPRYRCLTWFNRWSSEPCFTTSGWLVRGALPLVGRPCPFPVLSPACFPRSFAGLRAGSLSSLHLLSIFPPFAPQGDRAASACSGRPASGTASSSPATFPFLRPFLFLHCAALPLPGFADGRIRRRVRGRDDRTHQYRV